MNNLDKELSLKSDKYKTGSLMKNFYICFTIFLMFSCGKESTSNSSDSSKDSAVETEKPEAPKPESTKQLIVLPEVQEFFDDMEEFNRVYVKGSPIDNVVFEFIEDDSDSRLEMPAKGFCDKSGKTPKIYLYRPQWTGSYTQTYFHRFASFYHLVGHCVFNKAHDDKTMTIYFGGSTYHRPFSFMHSDFGRWRYPPGSESNFVEIIRDLKREFFNYYGPL